VTNAKNSNRTQVPIILALDRVCSLGLSFRYDNAGRAACDQAGGEHAHGKGPAGGLPGTGEGAGENIVRGGGNRSERPGVSTTAPAVEDFGDRCYPDFARDLKRMERALARQTGQPPWEEDLRRIRWRTFDERAHRGGTKAPSGSHGPSGFFRQNVMPSRSPTIDGHK